MRHDRPTRFQYRQVDSQPRRPRHTGPVGWSLVIDAVLISLVALVAISTGETAVGVIACGGMVIAAWGLVLAELVTRYR